MDHYKRNHLLGVLKAMANANRLKILETIKASKTGSVTVNEIVEALDMAQSVVSAHLKLMRLSKVVQAKQDGKNMHYSIKDPVANNLVGLLK